MWYFFGTTSVTGGQGNDNNTIDHCEIDASQSGIGIYSAGSTSDNRNSGNILSNNLIHDFYPFQYSTAAIAAGIYLNAGNKEWTITGNSIYQTALRVYNKPTIGATATYFGIAVSDITDGYSFTISNNYIGGNTLNAGGTPFSISGSVKLYAIYLNGASSAPPSNSSFQGNIIKNISISSTISVGAELFCGMYIQSGQVDIGTISGNIIGSETVTNSISVTRGVVSSVVNSVSGIRRVNAHSGNISNNIIGGITISSMDASTAVLFYGLYISGAGSISSNIIGSRTVANSIVNSSGTDIASGSLVNYGILVSTNSTEITGNTIANMNFSTASPAFQFIGINSLQGEQYNREVYNKQYHT